MTYIPQPVADRNGEQTVIVNDMSVVDLLQQILVTLNRIEYHLSLGTDNDLSNYDNIGG